MIEIHCKEVKRETEKAVLANVIVLNCMGSWQDVELWFPKAHIELSENNRLKLAEWLFKAKEEELARMMFGFGRFQQIDSEFADELEAEIAAQQ